MELNDQVAIITGGAQGMGRAFALKFAAEGARVTVADLNAEGAQSVVDEIARAGGPSASSHKVDVTSAAEVDAMVAGVLAQHGRIDVLMNNAGLGRFKGFMDLAPEEHELIWRTNVLSCVLCTRAVLPSMLRQGRGNIINMASQAGKRGEPITSAYGPAKAAVELLTQCISLEFAGRGIRCNAISPGIIKTPFWVRGVTADLAALAGSPFAGKSSDEIVAAVESEIPIGRMGDPDEVADVAVFLASERSRYITGATIDVTGGNWPK